MSAIKWRIAGLSSLVFASFATTAEAIVMPAAAGAAVDGAVDHCFDRGLSTNGRGSRVQNGCSSPPGQWFRVSTPAVPSNRNIRATGCQTGCGGGALIMCTAFLVDTTGWTTWASSNKALSPCNTRVLLGSATPSALSGMVFECNMPAGGNPNDCYLGSVEY